MKGRLKGAQKGHSLLKKKADALQMKFRLILKKIIDTKTLMGDVMKEASFSLAEAKFAAGGDFNQAVLQNVNKAQIKVKKPNKQQICRDNLDQGMKVLFEFIKDYSTSDSQFLSLYEDLQKVFETNV